LCCLNFPIPYYSCVIPVAVSLSERVRFVQKVEKVRVNTYRYLEGQELFQMLLRCYIRIPKTC